MTVLRARHRIAAFLAVLLAAAGPPTVAEEPARQDLWTRLGVDGALKDRIRASIDRGAAFLRTRQRPSGSWRENRASDPKHGEPLVTVLCAWALRTADASGTEKEVRRASEWILGGPDREKDRESGGHPDDRRWLLESTTITGSIGLAHFARLPDRRTYAKKLHGLVVGAQERATSWWEDEMGPWKSLGRASGGERLHGIADLEATWWAVHGLRVWAGTGLDVPAKAWMDVISSLCDRQTEGGGWRELPYDPAAIRVRPQPLEEEETGAVVGLAALLTAREALRDARALPGGLVDRVDRAVARARPAFDAEAALVVAGLPYLEHELHVDYFVVQLVHAPKSLPHRAVFGLLPLKAACLAGGIDRIDGHPWFADAARTLIERQGSDGSWGPRKNAASPGSEIETALVVLFLSLDETPPSATTPPVTPPARPIPR